MAGETGEVGSVEAPKDRGILRRLLPWVALGVLSVLGAEVVLSLFARLSPAIDYRLKAPWEREFVEDPVLGRRLPVFEPQHDDRGYRNAGVPEQVGVLAVGDSFTYGYGVVREDAWPQQLARQTGLAVYNAGVGGYGPCEYVEVALELLDLEPDIVLVGLMLGNDIINAYTSALFEGRFPRYAPTDTALVAEIEAADAVASLEERARAAGLVVESHRVAEAGDEPRPLRRWVSEHSSLYRLARELLRVARAGSSETRALRSTFEEAAGRPGRVAHEAAGFRTVFRLLGVDALSIDIGDPRIRAGLQITADALLRLRDELAVRDIALGVVLVPNKLPGWETLLSLVGDSSAPPEYLAAALLARARTADLTRMLAQAGIPTVDSAELIRERFAKGVMPYFEDDDYHMNADGYAAIAEAAIPLVRDARAVRDRGG